MKVAYYFPKEYPDQPFCKYATEMFGVEFLMNSCSADCDVIYCGTISQIDFAIQAQKEFNKKLICWVWDVPVFSAWHMQEFTRKAELLKQCNLVVSASKFTQTLLENVGIASVQMYGYIDVPTLESVVVEEKHPRRVIQVSRFVPIKLFDNTILAFLDEPDIELVLVGPGIVDPTYTRTLNMLAAGATNITFKYGLDWTDVIKEIKQSTVLVSPSAFEGWGMTPVEALFCNVPVILNDLPVFREVYGDSDIYCDGDDPASIAFKVKAVLDDPSLQENIVTYLRPHVQEFNPRSYSARWYAMIKEGINAA